MRTMADDVMPASMLMGFAGSMVVGGLAWAAVILAVVFYA